MIEPRFCRVMARYNLWQNANLMDAASTLDEADLCLDRGAFFGSIVATFDHLLWGDAIWMSRLDGWPKPAGGPDERIGLSQGWEAFKQARSIADTRILDWSLRLAVGDLGGPLTWYSGIEKAELTKPMSLCVQHFFNHQTHHRGQIHAMLTAAGARPGDTDLIFMTEGE